MKPRSELSAREVDDLHASLAQRLGDTTVPSLPQVAIKIIGLVSDPNSTIKQFADVISGDQALTGRLLRMANSAAFAQRGAVTKIERAMVLLGLERLKALALGFHLSNAAAGDDSALGFKSMWTQSLFRGCLAMKIAEKINKACSGEAFVIGFMADAGVPTMSSLVGDAYPGDMAVASHPTKLHAHERNTFQCTHVDVMMAMSRIWKLPERLSKPINNHHTRPASCDMRDDMSLLNSIAYFVGNLPLTPDGTVSESAASARDAQRLFQIGADELRSLLTESGKDFEAYRTLFGDIMDPAMSVDQILEEANNHLSEELESDADAPNATVTAGGMTLTLLSRSRGVITVNVSETGGESLVSEEIDPKATSEAELRERLLIENATPDEMSALTQAIAKLAA